MIARKAPPAQGIDLFGYSRTSVTIRPDGRGLAVADAWEQDTPLGTQVSGALFAPSRTEAGTLLRRLPARPDGVVVGVEEVPGSINYKATPFTNPADLLRQSAEFTTPRAGRADFGLDVPLTHLQPLPRKHDNNTWAALTFDVRAAGLLQAVERLQMEDGSVRPRLDARFLAPLRAFLLLGQVQSDETVIFSHLDLFDSLHVLIHRGSPVHLVRYQTGLAHFAAEDSSATDEHLEAAVAALYRDGFRDGSARGYCTLMNMVVEAVRQRLSGVTQSQRQSSDAVRLQRIVISGPLTDHPSLLATRIRAAGTIAVEAFRPVAALERVPSAVAAHAGRYTVALGHALNLLHAEEPLGLPVDLTSRLSLDQLPRERRAASSIIEVKAVKRQARAKPKTALSLGKYAKVAQLAYLMPLAAAASIGSKLIEARQLEADLATEQARHDQTAATVLQVKDAVAERQSLAERQHALDVLEAARAWPARLLHATGAAMGAAPHDVWLTNLVVNAAGQVQFSGRAEAYPSVAAFFDALGRDSAFAGVTFKRADRGVDGVAFQIDATILGIPRVPPSPPAGASGAPTATAAPAASASAAAQ